MPVTTLDYSKATIKMAVTSEVEAKYRAKACVKEPWTVEFIESMKHGDVLWDVGANVGSYSLLAAALGHDVVAIEPGLANFNALLQNGNLNRTEGRIQVINVLLGATTEKVPFSQSGMPGLGEGGGLSFEVQQIRMDELVFSETELPKPTHLKIDVDGHELAVLAGAEMTLRGSPLRAIMLEVKLGLGTRCQDLLERWGWTRTALFDKRNGEKLVAVAYEQYERTPAAPAA